MGFFLVFVVLLIFFVISFDDLVGEFVFFFCIVWSCVVRGFGAIFFLVDIESEL